MEVEYKRKDKVQNRLLNDVETCWGGSKGEDGTYTAIWAKLQVVFKPKCMLFPGQMATKNSARGSQRRKTAYTSDEIMKGFIR